MRAFLSLIVLTLLFSGVIQAQDERILPVAQVMPTLEKCADIQDTGDRRICNDEAVSRHIVGNLKYPAEAKQAGKEGHVIVRFVVDTKGKVSDFTVDEDPGFGMADEAIRVIKKLGKWSPGMNHGKPVKVRLAIPVRFELEEMPSEPEVSRPDVYVIADQMPRYSGCGEMEDAEARQCTFERILDYTRSNLVYPEEARNQHISGDVIVKFVVNTDGAVSAVEVKQGIGGGCDEEAVRLVKAMPAWTPGLVDGQKVKVEMTLPFKFVPTSNE